MADLVAQGIKPDQRWRRSLPEDQPLVLGREAGMWAADWESFLSRRHARLTWRAGQLEVERLPEARNPIFVKGAEAATFTVRPGEYFVIGETTFTVAEEAVTQVADANSPMAEQTFSAQELRQLRFHDAPRRLDVLSRLPDVISGAADDVELVVRLVNMLLAGIPGAEVTALVAVEPSGGGGDAQVNVLQWDRRLATGSGFQPSRRLVLEAVQRQQKTVLHLWGRAGDTNSQAYTLTADNLDWAFCTPVRGEACRGWGIYVAGRFSSEHGTVATEQWETTELRDDLKFTELVAAVLSALRQVQMLQRRQASLSRFFSPAVLRTLNENPSEGSLKPQETEVTILFCDLRGFSRESEKAASLLSLLERVSKALGVMTQNILDHGGVIGDFHGDAAMGFWGWPIAAPDAVERACLAALGIRTCLEMVQRKQEHLLQGFQVGVGLATGRAVAGPIGTVDQVKVTVFGPIVNLASRLEGMTKILRAPILMDETTAGIVRERVRPELARCRRVAQVKPYGLASSLIVTELLPPASEYPELTDAHLVDYEKAVDAFIEGDWERAYEFLRRMPAEDRVQDFLTVYIARHDRRPPTGWKGVIALESKT